MRKTAIATVVTGVAASLVLGACSSGSKSSSTGVAPSAAAAKVSTLTAPADGTVISVAPAAASDPKAPAVVAFLDEYFNTIANRDFGLYFKLYTPQYRAKLGDSAAVAKGYRSTELSEIRLTDLTTLGDGRTAAMTTFTSNQDAVDGPDGQKCTHWKKHFFLIKAGDSFLIDSPPSAYHTTYSSC